MDQRDNQADAHPGDNKGHQRGKIDNHLALRVFDVKIVERGKQAQHVGAVGNRAQLIPLEDGADDFRKAKGGDGEIVAFKAQHRQADQKREKCREAARQDERGDHRHRELHQAAVVILVHSGALRYRDGEDAVGIGANQHKARLAQ